MCTDAQPCLPGLGGSAPIGGRKRYRRRNRPRAQTIAIGKMQRRRRFQLPIAAPFSPEMERALAEDRPKTRGDCEGGERPCPWVGCAMNLYIDVNAETGSIKLNYPDLEPWQMGESCALDIADRGGVTLDEVGDVMNLTREAVRLYEIRGLRKLRVAAPEEMEDFDR